MRPVLLRMEGFAAFRAETTVDFREAEYFALIGPTGAGKSTVIDAMIFALYGSVPRWDDRRAVRLALAPTTMRGTVSLVFDLGDHRYVVARELRRAASGTVTVREARLEQFLDPSSSATGDDETISLAAGSEVTPAVTELLGLPFEDFCTCVVLPQGDFAEFLHAAPNKRQEKLENLLGLGVYDQIMKRANTEATSAIQRAGFLTEQLLGLADATPEAQRAAEDRVGAFDSLADLVVATVPEITAAAAAVTAAETDRDRLATERAALAAVATPGGLEVLVEHHRARNATLAQASEHATAAEGAEFTAREQLDAAPDRAGLEQTRRAHLEFDETTAKLPDAQQQRAQAAADYTAATTHAAATTRRVDAARDALEAARETERTTQETTRRLTAEHDALHAPTVPAGLEDLHARTSAARASRDRAEQHLAAAETTETAAQAALAAGPRRGPLEQARRDHHDLAEARGEHHTVAEHLVAEKQRAAEAAAQADSQRADLQTARRECARQTHANLAAELRPQLVVGDRCPVCAQDVEHVPAPLPSADLDAARAAETAAEKAYDEANATRVAADAAVDRAADHVQRVDTRIRELTAALVDAPPSLGAVDEALAELDRLDAEAEQALAALRGARRARDDALHVDEDLRREGAVAETALQSARAPLLTLGAPPLVDTSPLTGWRALVDWARGLAKEREAALTVAQKAAGDAARQRVEAERDRTAADHADAEARRAVTEAARADQQADGTVATLENRVHDLTSALDGAPTLEAVESGLARLTELENAARDAAGAARTARAALTAARTALNEVQHEISTAWTTWHRVRDPLVAVGAPSPGDDLETAWRTLTAWASAETTTRDRALVDADELVVRRRAVRDDTEEGLAAALAGHGLTATPATASATVAAASERARGELSRVTERRAQADDLDQQRRGAEEDAQVARMLADQLRSNRFPRWLVASALDVLVVDASASLATLSGGQFELTHDNGEFLVVDHADADQHRPVKTLSGGETFQASLALALALSSQLQGLAAQGAARLESIFLDEGFGTLDETTLDLVATALENLSASGDRMVGIVTHVTALAERVPLRYVVSRDQRTSSVVREGV